MDKLSLKELDQKMLQTF